MGRWMAVVVLTAIGLAFYVPVQAQAHSLANVPLLALEEPSMGMQAQEPASRPVELQVEYGYDGAAKGGRYLPLTVAMDNHQSAAVEGSLQVQVLESDGTVYRYDYAVDIGSGGQTVLKEYVPLGNHAGQLFLRFENGQGQVLAEKKVKLNISLDVPELFIGVLSDEPQKLQYLDGVGISYSTLRTRMFAMKQEEFPLDEAGLNLLDVLVVNNYKLRNLSERQTAAIMDWVHGGGVLILGTGMRVDDTLGRFAPELLDDSYGTPTMQMVNLGEDFQQDNPGEGILEMACVDIPLHGGNVILSSEGTALLTAVAKEQGLIGVTAFDLADISAFCEQQNTYVDHLFTSLLGETRINRLAEVTYSGNSGRFWSVQSLINTGDVEQLPNLPLYMAVVMVYLLLLGPGLYLFLKRRELQVYYRRGVVALSLVFAVAIYLMGNGTRFESAFYTYAAIQDVTEDYVMETAYVNVRNPYNRPYEVELEPAYSILPITRSFQREGSRSQELTGNEAYQTAIIRQEGRLAIRGQNIVAFAPRYFQLEKKSENTEKIGITGEVDYFQGRLSGSVTNQFPFPLENAALILYGSMIYLDRLEPGETRILENVELLQYPLNNSYVLAEYVTGRERLLGKNVLDADSLQAMKRANLLMFYLDNYMTSYTADARVIAFSEKHGGSRFLKDSEPEISGLTMLTSSIGVNASRDRVLYRSVLMKTPKVSSGIYDAQTNSMAAMEPLTLEYHLGSDIQVESLAFEEVAQEFLTETGGSYMEAFTGGIYFYNHSSGNYDRMELRDRTLDAQELRPYLSPDNILTVRYVYEGTGSYHDIQLPMPMVAGRER